jgi:hypothetical protein
MVSALARPSRLSRQPRSSGVGLGRCRTSHFVYRSRSLFRHGSIASGQGRCGMCCRSYRSQRSEFHPTLLWSCLWHSTIEFVDYVYSGGGYCECLLVALVGCHVGLYAVSIAGRSRRILIVGLVDISTNLSQCIWFVVALLQMVAAFVGWAQTMVTYAYLPELTHSEHRLQSYIQTFTLLQFAAMISYLLLVLGVAYACGWGEDDSVYVAQLAMAVSFVCAAICLFLAWGFLLQPRPPAHTTLPPGQSLWTVGFIQVYRTMVRIHRELPDLKWFYIAVALIDAGIGSLAAVSITYLTDILGFTAQENGTAILCILVGCCPGSALSTWVSRKTHPVRSCMVGTLLLLVNTLLVASVLHRPGQQVQTYILAFVWGIGWGWKWTIDRHVASTIIPVGTYI